VKPHDLFGIDVAAEITTLCAAQLQGPWQVPAEIVRLANARGAARVEIERRGRGIEIRCDGVLATLSELQGLMEIMDEGADARRRQAAVAEMESAGLSVLLWALGLAGARLRMSVRSGGGTVSLSSRRGYIDLDVDHSRTGLPQTIMMWRCRGLSVRRAVSWLKTAVRFVPIPVCVLGRQVDRGFRDGLYRMRIRMPVEGELAVTSSGEAASLWLLEKGVLSARAIIPGFPPFSAAIEMSETVPAGASADELRQSAGPFLEDLIDEAARMLILLVDRLPTVDEPIRARLTTLLLRFAVRGIRRDQILAAKVIRVRRGSRRWMESPREVAGWADKDRGVLRAIDPADTGKGGTRLVEATTEERALLSELLELRIERVADTNRAGLGPRLGSLMRRAWRRILGMVGPAVIAESELTLEERALVNAWAGADLELALCAGMGAMRRRGSAVILGRDRAEVRAAARVVAGSDEWVYPAILVAAGDLEIATEISDDIRNRWRNAIPGDLRSSSKSAGGS